MRSTTILTCFFATLGGLGCVLTDDEPPAGGTAEATGADASTAASTGSNPTEPPPDTDITGTDGVGEGTAMTTGHSPDTGSDTDDPPAAQCTTATLLLGNPYYDGELGGSNPAGHGLRDDPPLRSRHLAEVGGRLAIDTQTEIWIADAPDLSRAATLVRVAGSELSEADRYRPIGTCAEARFLLAEGIAGLPDGRLVVADARGNGLVELASPLADDCMATSIAGNPEMTLDVDIDDWGAPGDVDGPGAEARFRGVSRPVADEAGNVYVIDRGNAKIKRVADDADRTVTTLHTFVDGGNPLAMTVLDGVLYVVGTSGVDDALWAIDPEAGGAEALFIGTGLFAEIDRDDPALMLALDHDGVDLLVGSHEGYVLRLGTAAFAKGAIAGYGPVIDFPSDLDLDAPIPVAELPIDSYSINEGSVLRFGDDILVANVADGTGYHVWAIHCE